MKVPNISNKGQPCSNVWKWNLGTEKGWAELARKNRNENVEMDDGNKMDWEDQEWRNKSMGRYGKHKRENKSPKKRDRWLDRVERQTE